MDILTGIGIIVGLFMVILIISAVLIFLDLMSYTGSGLKSLIPAGNVTGKALVAFNPGISGIAKKATYEIVGQLNSQGYEVDLVGVRRAPSDTSDYDVVIVGGPMYGGKATKSIETYLKRIQLEKEVKLGVFTTTGTDQFNEEDFQSLTRQVDRLIDIPLNHKPTVKLIRSGNKSLEDYMDLVSETIK